MNIQTVNVLIAIQDIEKQASMMEYEANKMLQKAEGLRLAAESLKKDFSTEISIYENRISKSTSE